MGEKKLIRFDWAMKHILREKANFDIIEGFLSALLEEEITVEKILENESNQENATDKFNNIDVLVKDSKGRNVIIEIFQSSDVNDLYRILYETSKYITKSIASEDSYYRMLKICKVISVGIFDCDLGIGEDYLYHGKNHFIGQTTNTSLEEEEDFSFRKLLKKYTKFNEIEIFPEYYLIQINKYQDEVKKAIDEWIYWFKNEKLKNGSSSKHIEKVETRFDILHMNEVQRKKYETYLEVMDSN